MTNPKPPADSHLPPPHIVNESDWPEVDPGDDDDDFDVTEDDDEDGEAGEDDDDFDVTEDPDWMPSDDEAKVVPLGTSDNLKP